MILCKEFNYIFYDINNFELKLINMKPLHYRHYKLFDNSLQLIKKVTFLRYSVMNEHKIRDTYPITDLYYWLENKNIYIYPLNENYYIMYHYTEVYCTEINIKLISYSLNDLNILLDYQISANNDLIKFFNKVQTINKMDSQFEKVKTHIINFYESSSLIERIKI